MTEPSAAIPDTGQAIAVLREAIDILQTDLQGMRDLPMEEPERTTAMRRVRLATMAAPVLDAFNGASTPRAAAPVNPWRRPVPISAACSSSLTPLTRPPRAWN